jgi:hypothetical protein
MDAGGAPMIPLDMEYVGEDGVTWVLQLPIESL